MEMGKGKEIGIVGDLITKGERGKEEGTRRKKKGGREMEGRRRESEGGGGV